VSAGGKRVLERVSEEYDTKIWTGLKWFMIGPMYGLL
jgi:hypothetical protein